MLSYPDTTTACSTSTTDSNPQASACRANEVIHAGSAVTPVRTGGMMPNCMGLLAFVDVPPGR